MNTQSACLGGHHGYGGHAGLDPTAFHGGQALVSVAWDDLAWCGSKLVQSACASLG
jgi:hypothetical protein